MNRRDHQKDTISSPGVHATCGFVLVSTCYLLLKLIAEHFGSQRKLTAAGRSQTSPSLRLRFDRNRHPSIRWCVEPIGYVPPAEYEARYYEQAAVA